MLWDWPTIAFFVVLIVVVTATIIVFGEHQLLVKSKITISVPDQVHNYKINKIFLLASFLLIGLGAVLWLYDNNKLYSSITFLGSMWCLWILSRGQVFINWLYTSIFVIIVLLFTYLNYGKW